MEHLVPTALIIFLLTVAFGRIWARRSLALLDTEQKAQALDALTRGYVWPFVCTALAVGVIDWPPIHWIPAYFRPGLFATLVMLPFLISVGAGATNWIRLSRAGLPRAYLRSVRLQAIAFHVALLFVFAAIIYDLYATYQRRNHRRQSSNQAMQLTAGRSAFALNRDFVRLGCDFRSLSGAVADLVSR